MRVSWLGHVYFPGAETIYIILHLWSTGPWKPRSGNLSCSLKLHNTESFLSVSSFLLYCLGRVCTYIDFATDTSSCKGQVTKWILSHDWTVGDLWNMMLEYSAQRLYKQTNLGFFSWLLPSLPTNNEAISPSWLSANLPWSSRLPHFKLYLCVFPHRYVKVIIFN